MEKSRSFFDGIKNWIRPSSLPGYSLIQILRLAIRRFGMLRGAEAAAGTAFYTIFSLFPTLLVVVAIGSFLLEREEVQRQILDIIRFTFPVSPELIVTNIQEVLDLRGPVGVLGFIGLVWSGSGIFTILSRNINLAFPSATPRTFVQSRLIGFAMLASLIVLLAVSSLTLAVLNLLAEISEPLLGFDLIAAVPFWNVITTSISFLAGFIIFFALYRWIPNTAVTWGAAFWAALVTATAWQLTTLAFTWYLRSGLAEYRLVYGSLGAIVALMFWIYLNFLIIFFGAHLTAAIVHHAESKKRR